MITTLTGNNEYTRKAALSALVQDFITEHSDIAIERYDGEEISVDRMRESVQSLPFLSARKLVVLRAPSKQKSFSDAIHDVINNCAETTDLIIYEPKLDKRSVYYKTLKKETDFRSYDELDSFELARWATEHAKGQGGVLSQADAKLLVDRLGLNQQMLGSELQKLLSFDPHITRGSIERLTEANPQSTVFELIDAALAKKTARAFALYREQRALKVEPQAIIALLAWQLHILAIVKAAGSRPASEIASEAKLNPFVVRKSMQLIRGVSLERIKELIADLLALDRQLKRSSIDADEALQLFILKLSGT